MKTDNPNFGIEYAKISVQKDTWLIQHESKSKQI